MFKNESSSNTFTEDVPLFIELQQHCHMSVQYELLYMFDTIHFSFYV